MDKNLRSLLLVCNLRALDVSFAAASKRVARNVILLEWVRQDRQKHPSDFGNRI